MILVDTSAWIDYFNQRASTVADRLEHALQRERVVVGDLVMTELLQGVRLDREVTRILDDLDRLDTVALCGADIAVVAAANYRSLRRRGITIRSTIDVIIGTWCIVNDVPLLHNDRDMAAMETHLGLRAYA